MYKRGRTWWINYTLADGTHRYESSGTSNKRLAQKLQDMRRGAIAEGRLKLPRSNPPRLKTYSDDFLGAISNPKTNARYLTSIRSHLAYFANVKLSQITADRVEAFKQARLHSGVGPATVNRDLAVLRRMLRLAVRQRLIAYSPFDEVEFLEERKQRRQPHILTFEEQHRLLAASPSHLKMLIVLITETGLRVGKEALPLKWEDVDFLHDVIHVRQSKTAAGIRAVPLSDFCKSELHEWRGIAGPGFSDYVFPNYDELNTHLGSVKTAWRTSLKAAGIPYFPIYNLRATFASRLSASGTPDLFVAQMMGHSGTSILHAYAKAIDESRREAIKKFEAYRESHLKDVGSVAPASPDSHPPDKQSAPVRSMISKKPFLN